MISIRSKVLTRGSKDFIKKRFRAFLPKPYVLPDKLPARQKFPKGCRGGVILTADFELAWAVRYSKRSLDPLALARAERANVPVILAVAERFKIPITWATVGHLFLESCNRGDHDWMARLPYLDDHWKFTSGDWFDHDPHTSVDKDPEWYAPDLLTAIIASPVRHEIACHTFSHIDCSDKNCPPRVLDDELKTCAAEAKTWGLALRSMAFPGGTAGNFAVLRKHGIKIYRRRVGKYELAYPFRDDEGLLVSPTGPMIGRAHPDWSLEEEFYFYRKAIDKAIRHNTLAHMWFHPSANLETFEQLMPLIMEYCARKRDSGDLWVGTMDQMQKHINESQII